MIKSWILWRKPLRKNDRVKDVEIIVNGKRVPLNYFVKKIVGNLALAMIEPLKREDEDESIKEIVIKVSNTS